MTYTIYHDNSEPRTHSLLFQGDGETDDTEAINRAASDGQRCGEDCAGTSTAGALVYFPVSDQVSTLYQCIFNNFSPAHMW